MGEESLPPTDWKYCWDARRDFSIEADPSALDERTLPEGLELCSADHADPVSFLREACALLADNYVEDPDGDFGFAYSVEFLQWALGGPESNPDLLLGIRQSATGDLVGFFSAVPIDVILDGVTHKSGAIDFVCVRKDQRGQRLCPFMYHAARQRCLAAGIPTSVKTSGDVLPTPVAQPLYFHRIMPRALKKLISVRFAGLPS